MDSQGQAEREVSQNAAKNPTIRSLYELHLDLDIVDGGWRRGCGPRLRPYDEARDRGSDQPQYDAPWGPFALCAHGEVLLKAVLPRD
ncbi:MAG: hypothetical protein JRI98_00720 [Deltaproteobacteria bacterium]|nr:hypothetical protein [Deltaproteobacteria bacterium]